MWIHYNLTALSQLRPRFKISSLRPNDIESYLLNFAIICMVIKDILTSKVDFLQNQCPYQYSPLGRHSMLAKVFSHYHWHWQRR